MISILRAGGSERLGVEELDTVLASLRGSPGEVTWVHLETSEVVDAALERFGLHEIAVRGLQGGPERPRVEEFGDHLYVSLLRVPAAGPGSTGTGAPEVLHALGPASLEELRVFMGERWVISRGRLSPGEFDALADIVRRQVFDRSRGPGYILYFLADWVVDSVYPVLDDVVERVDTLEGLALEEDGGEFREQLLALKRDVVDLRRGMVPMRDVMQRLSGRGLAFLDEASMVFFRDVHDDVLAVLEQLDMQHDILASTLDLHLAAVSNRLNKVMQKLTVVATVFMPLTFITGFFGQNFVQLPYRSDFWFVMMLLATVGGVVGMLLYFRRKRWM